MSRSPQILVPLKYASKDGGDQDIVVYLRPETNGVLVESVLFRVLNNTEWKQKLTLAYLANLPGEFILRRRIVERHYSSRLDFAVRGKQAFTSSMQATFERFFGVPFAKARIYGAFEALQILMISAEDLFQLWVPVYDILEISGQLVKRLPDNRFIVNYDIPALLHKNHAGTDVAVMLFRTDLGYQAFKPVVDAVRGALIASGLLDSSKTERRIFHYSKGPFEQLLDGTGYLWKNENSSAGLADLQFGLYLLSRGISEKAIYSCLQSPIGRFKLENGNIVEQNIFSYTLFDDFETAWKKLIQRQERGKDE